MATTAEKVLSASASVPPASPIAISASSTQTGKAESFLGLDTAAGAGVIENNSIRKKLEEILAQAEGVMAAAEKIHKSISDCASGGAKDLGTGGDAKAKLDAVIAEAPPKLRAELEAVRDMAEDSHIQGGGALAKASRALTLLQESIDTGSAANTKLREIIRRIASLKSGEDFKNAPALVFSGAIAAAASAGAGAGASASAGTSVATKPLEPVKVGSSCRIT